MASYSPREARMSPEQWQQLKELYARVEECASQERTALPQQIEAEDPRAGGSAPSSAGTLRPDRFGSIQDSRTFCRQFFPWYTEEHRHSGLGLLTPAMVHFDQAET